MRRAIDERAIDEIDPASQADASAESAARKSGVILADLEGLDSLKEAARLFDSVWSVPDGLPMIGAELLRSLTSAGNYLAGAFSGDRMVGAIVGFLGLDTEGQLLHSHILGVLPETQSRNVGFALKQHQRAWALARGIRTIQWTYDPLVRRNAYFNIMKLGAGAAKYFPNFYGPMHDGINGGDESDRLLISWDLESQQAAEASEERPSEPNLGELLSAGAVRALGEGGDGAPVVSRQPGRLILCSVPHDIVSLRATNSQLAARWRKALREVLGGRMAEGYVVTGFSRSGSYVLAAPGEAATG